MNEGYQILAQSLSSEQRKALQVIKGTATIDPLTVSIEPYVILRECRLVNISDLGDGRSLIWLTEKGRKVAAYV